MEEEFFRATRVAGIDGVDLLWSGHAIERAKERVADFGEDIPTKSIVRQGMRMPLREQWRLASGSVVYVCERIRENLIHIVTVIPRCG